MLISSKISSSYPIREIFEFQPATYKIFISRMKKRQLPASQAASEVA